MQIRYWRYLITIFPEIASVPMLQHILASVCFILVVGFFKVIVRDWIIALSISKGSMGNRMFLSKTTFGSPLKQGLRWSCVQQSNHLKRFTVSICSINRVSKTAVIDTFSELMVLSKPLNHKNSLCVQFNIQWKETAQVTRLGD